MTNAKFYDNSNGKIVKFEISGHSGYADNGFDIVCAAVSSVCQAAVIGICELLSIDAETVADNDGYLYMALPCDLEYDTLYRADIIIRTAYVFLSRLREQYPEYLSVSLKKVKK